MEVGTDGAPNACLLGADHVDSNKYNSLDESNRAMQRADCSGTLRWSSLSPGQLDLEHLDGTREVIPACTVQRSEFLQNAPVSDTDELVLLPTEQRSFASWLRFLALQAPDRLSASNTELLGALQASIDFQDILCMLIMLYCLVMPQISNCQGLDTSR